MIVYHKVGIAGQPFDWNTGRLVAGYFPSFTKFVIDPTGIRDAVLAGFVLSLSSDVSIIESAVASGKMGNRPVLLMA